MTHIPAHILVVEDSQLNRSMLARDLRQQGHTVTLAENGQQALDMMQAQSFDLVLLDILMPEMDGYHTLAHMKNASTLRDVPVIVISVIDDMDSIVKCIELGAEDYLTKPVAPVLLKAKINACLEKKQLRDQEQTHLKQLQERNRAQHQLNRLGQQLAAMLDLQQITKHLPQAIAEIVGAQGASLWLWDEGHEGWLVCRAIFHPGLAASALISQRLRPGEGLAGWVAQQGKSLIVPDVLNDARFFPGIDTQTGFHTQSLLATPLRVNYAIIGVMEVVNKLDGNFDADDLALVETLAVSAAIAIDNAVLFEARRQLSDELKARNEELDAFSYTVAHDLKGVLTNIVGFASVVRDSYAKMSDEQIQQCLHMVTRSGQKMTSIVDELMLLANIHTLASVDMRALDMAQIVTEVQDRLLFMIEEHHAEIILPKATAWPVAMGHGPWVEEVWVNYISNAIKYGGQPPRVELGATLQENGFVRFWVSDNGDGLSPEEQGRLFTPFERLHQVRAEGHGLGLPIVRRIVEKLGGRVGIESQMGRGSVFSFTLPSEDLSQSIAITHSDWTSRK